MLYSNVNIFCPINVSKACAILDAIYIIKISYDCSRKTFVYKRPITLQTIQENLNYKTFQSQIISIQYFVYLARTCNPFKHYLYIISNSTLTIFFLCSHLPCYSLIIILHLINFRLEIVLSAFNMFKYIGYIPYHCDVFNKKILIRQCINVSKRCRYE